MSLRRQVLTDAWVIVGATIVAVASLGWSQENSSARTLLANQRQPTDRDMQPGPAAPRSDLPFRRPDQLDRSHASPPDPRHLWKLYGITEDHWQSFDDQPGFTPQERNVLLRLSDRLGQMELAELESLSLADERAQQAWMDPPTHRGHVVRLHGTAEKVERDSLADEERTLYHFSELYRVRIRARDLGTVDVLCRWVPQSWLSCDRLSEPVETAAVLLEGTSTGAAFLHLATVRLRWYPKTPDDRLGTTSFHVRLSQGGLDMSFLDIVRQSNFQPLTKSDREPFYAFLHVASQLDTATLRTDQFAPFDLAHILLDPAKCQGNIYSFTATARRITRVTIDDEDIRQKYHRDSYYEIDIMIPIGDTPIRLKTAKGQDGPVYENRYPATVCAWQVPPQLQNAARDAASGRSNSPLINETIRVQGVFFKIWTYPSEYVSSLAPGQLQPSPLFMANSIDVIASEPPKRDDWFSWLFASVFVVGFLLIIYAAWRNW